jgi:tetratricopeptide (TPR) repeat protein
MSDAYDLYQKGLGALAAGHADEAIVPLERAARMEPNSMSIQEALGKTYLQLGFYDRAIDAFATILSNEPLDAYAHFCIARAYDRKGRPPLARRHYRLATIYQPDRLVYRDTFRAFLARAYPDDGLMEIEDDDLDDIVEA